MATAVLDLDIQQLPATVEGLDGYSRVYVLLRYKKLPVGKIRLPVNKGVLYVEEFHKEILDAGGYNLWVAWMNDRYNLSQSPPLQSLPKATIAICTRNRTDDLKKCLDALQKLPNDGQEILVIDNCPSDESTKELVELYPGTRYVRESIKGLNVARNRALKESQNDIVAFTDDDAVPDPDWLRGLLKNFEHPLVGCTTGITVPLELETEGQEAFENYSAFDKGFMRRVHSSASRNPLSSGEVGAGANMAIRKSILPEVGLFDEALDAGTPTQSGGDHEFFARVLLRGFQIVYDPAALSWHRHRRTWKETKQAIHGYGVGVYAFWTRLFLVEKEYSILKFPWYWFKNIQLPNLVRSLLRRRNSQPTELIVAEILGCAKGPWAYLSARREVKRRENHGK